jgi:uncharacterized flavoprotein (TIGR03862 family)
MAEAWVIGGGPAGLMAAEVLSTAGHGVTVADRKPSVGRKFLMAGKSGLNLTKAEARDTFLMQFPEPMRPIVADFDMDAVQSWAQGLGQPLFTGSTGRVFPTAMKASPLLRAWMTRLTAQGVVFRTGWHWAGFDNGEARFETPDGTRMIGADTFVLALGGASWRRLGSDGQWARDRDDVAAFRPANCGFAVPWSPYMTPHFGTPVKATMLSAGHLHSRGEWVLSRHGVEGGGIYEVSAAVRDGAQLTVDLLPDQSVAELVKRIAGRNRKKTVTAFLTKGLGLSPAKVALVNEVRLLQGVDDAAVWAARLKSVPLPCSDPLPLDQAISTAGGLRFDAVTEDLMLKSRPGVFVAGEMLDWEAITGGYLLTGCLATGRKAGTAAVRFMNRPVGA